MQPKIEVIGDVNKCLQYIKWAKQQWSLREGQWQKQLDTCLVFFKRQGDSGYILFQTFGLKGLVTNPHKAINSQFVLDATKDPLWVMDREGWPPLESSSPDQDKEIQVGNYYVLDKDDNVYSIKVPHHNLVGDIGSSVKGYTQYAWTTNVSQEDVFTCYSEFVYSGGEEYYAGTRANPEAVFKYGLVVGIGIDAEDNLHIAQLSEIPKGSGYWDFFKDGVSLGVFFGSESAAKAEAIKLDADPRSKWINDTDTRWWVEFHTGANGLDATLLKGLDIYRREAASRAGGNRQWFFDKTTKTWAQRSPVVPSTYRFDGLVSEDGYTKTVYRITPKISELFGKELVFTHTATSSSGVSGDHTEVDLAVKEMPVSSISIAQSADWPADGSYIHIQVSGSVCVTFTMSSTVPNTTLVEVVQGKEYKYVLSNRCVPNQNARAVSGVVTVAPSTGTPATLTAGYTTLAGSWHYVSTAYNPYYSLSGSGPTVPIYSGTTLTTLYTTTSVPAGYYTINQVRCLCDNGYGPASSYVPVYSEPPHLSIGPTEWDYYVGVVCPDNTPMGVCISDATPCWVYNNYPDACRDNYYPVVAKTVHEWRC